MERVDIKQVRRNPDNPRIIKDYKFNKLVKSIKEFPQMLDLRPIVVNKDMIVLGGNMRLKACEAAGLKEVPVIFADNLTEEQQKEFIIKDNSSFGEWDWDILANEWDVDLIQEWGLDLPVLFEDEEATNEDEPYTKKVDAPTYTPSDEAPDLSDLYDDTKAKKFVSKIKQSDVDPNIKDFLINAALRHMIFNYDKIADFYAHADKDVQELMEDIALIIIDFEKAIELGYVNINEKIAEQYLDEHAE